MIASTCRIACLSLDSNALVFVATNDGYLHAINAVDGVEAWSFIPRRLLGRLFELSLEQPVQVATIAGLAGLNQ